MTADVVNILQGLRISVDDMKRMMNEGSEATRHASTITGQDLSALEAALHTCFIPINEDQLQADVSTSISDQTEFEWDANKHEAGHKAQYMEVLEHEVRCAPVSSALGVSSNST